MKFNGKNQIKTFLTVTCLLAVAAFGSGQAMAAGKTKATAATVPLTEAGNKLEAQYSERLAALRVELAKALPAISEQKQATLKEARAATVAAEKMAGTAQKSADKIKEAKAAVDHAKFKWIAGADKDIAKAQAALKQATTEAEREAAQKNLAKAQTDREAGVKALAERQAALDKAQVDAARSTQASKAAQEALVQAQTKELNAAKAILADIGTFLASDTLDAKLVEGTVLAEATPRGLAEFAQQGKAQEALVAKLLANEKLMKEMLEAGGAKAGKYGQAMQIYADIQKASARATEGIFHRLALGTSLEHAVPIAQRLAETETKTPTMVDPVKRYRHYEKAYLDGELDPAFKDMTAWECRYIVDSYAPDSILAWGREMLRNYRPDHVLNPDYGWRYSGAVRTDVAYRHSQEYTDLASLQFFQNIIRNGGICGRRAFFGSYICKSFGIPTWGVAQHAHAALGRWTPAGWVVNFGANWGFSWYDGRQGADFLLETQGRKHPQDYLKVLRAQWVGSALGEKKRESFKPGSGGLWNVLALFENKIIVAEAKSTQLAALGQELAEANESAETKAMTVAKANITEADKKVSIAPNGVIKIPAAAVKGAQVMPSFLGGQQATCGGGACSFEVAVPTAGKYSLAAQVVTVHGEMSLPVTVNSSKNSVEMAIPYTCGQWQATQPVEVALVKGENVLSFSKPTSSFTIKQFTLTPAK